MIYVNNPQENLKLFEALASPVRLQIIEFLKGGELNINDIAKRLNLTNSALTMHIQKLSESGLIRIRLSSKQRGTQKLCSLTEDKLLIELVSNKSNDLFYESELNVGQYTDYAVNPTCGLGDAEGLIDTYDNVKAFSFPERFNANILWFTDGFVTYRFPNRLTSTQKATDLQISLEIGAESPGGAIHYPSDAIFTINGVTIAKYHTNGELVDRRGRFTPQWWSRAFGQYGKIKVLSITDEGTCIDGLKVSDVTLSDLNLLEGEPISLTIDCRDETKRNGGVTLFGKDFGDYKQGIRCRLFYKQEDESEDETIAE